MQRFSLPTQLAHRLAASAALAAIALVAGAERSDAAPRSGQAAQAGAEANTASQTESQAESRAESRAEADLDLAARRALATAPARSRIGRMRGARFVSRVTFVAQPDESQTLSLSLAFPARAHLTLKGEGGRFERFQLGDTWFGQDALRGATAASKRSFLLTGDNREETRLDLALRRALFLWPHGAAFSGTGPLRTATLPGLGVLVATIDGSTGRPDSIRIFDRDGRAAAELRDVHWRVDGDQAWPESLVFAVDGKPLWSEVVESVEVQWLFADTWFLPSDRIAGIVGRPIDAQLRMRVVEAAWTTRSMLPAGTTLARAFELALERCATTRERLGDRGLPGDSMVSIAFDGSQAPIAIEIEVDSNARSDAVLAAEKGWTRRGQSIAWMALCPSLEDVTPDAFAALAGAVAAGGEPAGTPRLRLDVSFGSGPTPSAPVATGGRIVQAFRARPSKPPAGDDSQ